MLTAGMLVEIQGLKEVAKPVESMQGLVQPMDLNGEKAQLIDFDRESGKWVAGTFSGTLVAVTEKFIKPLSAEAMEGLDFVMGPKSDPALVGGQLAQCLGTKGWAAVKVFVAKADTDAIMDVTKRLEEEDQFCRLAQEFEPGYLGKGGAAKTLHVDPSAASAPAYVQSSPLAVVDNNFSAISGMLMQYSAEHLGFEIYSRSSLLLRMPLFPDDEDKYPMGDVDEGDAEGYLHLMHRKQVVVLQFVGPSSGTLTLLPKRQGGEEVVLKAEPNTMVVIHCSQYDYSYVADGPSLALQTFLLNPPPVWELGELGGDVDILVGTDSGPRVPKDPNISVVSAYCRYGGGADGKEKYWTMTGNSGCDGCTDCPKTRWDMDVYYDPDMQYGGSYTKHGCWGIDGVDLFDSKFFEISPAEAKTMDPCQRQVMEVSYLALLGCGFDKKGLGRKSEHIGHFVGIDKDDWMFMGDVVRELGQGGAFGASSAANAITSNRFSFAMNLKGASMTIDTACSSSLVCTHVSKMHLRLQEWEPMPASIVNGLNLMLLPNVFIGCCGAGMLSHEGRCFTFNATADGYNRAELCGAMGFKQIKYDDNALCILAGTQANQDGRSASMTAPNGPAQERCVQAVLKETQLTPTEIDLFECHGTGTSLGDPIEIGSFKKVMSGTNRESPCFIVSSKSNISHGEGGAGLGGLMKCCMQVYHCEGAPNLHLKKLNPHLDLDGFPCQPLSEKQITREDGAYCGVSSFGFGGTNGHAQAYGKNIMTSRGARMKDPYLTFQRKLRGAPPAEVTINGDDVADWDTTGCDPKAEEGDKYLIRLDVDGIVEWEKQEPDVPDAYGDEFAIQGTFNNWEADEPMERHDTIPGLWVGYVTIGSTGEEEFQIIGDGDSDIVYSPSTAHSRSKADPIKGPGKADKEMAWCIRGTPGDTYKVEFFQQDDAKSIIWMKSSRFASTLDSSKTPCTLMFPGQGSQYVGMLKELKDLPAVKTMLEKANGILGYDILELCMNGPEEKLEETRYCQPALFIGGLAGIEKLRQEKPECADNPQFVAGLSLGEYTALCAAGVFTFEEGLKLVKLRGEAMQEAAKASKQKMLSVAGLDRELLDSLCAEAAKEEGPGATCSVANALFDKGFSVGGTEEAIMILQKKCETAGALNAKLLKTAGAFHTALMKPAEDKLNVALDACVMTPPTTTIYMNVTSEPVTPGTDPEIIKANLKKQLTSPVLWEPSIQKMIKAGISEYYECGPMKQLKAMMKRINQNVWKTTTNVDV
jgi:malonyl CoA-acyl carrier protein transacylase